MEERRRFARVAVQFGAKCAAVEDDPPETPGRLLGRVEEGEVKNISSGGVMLATERPIPMGTAVQLEIRCGESEEVVKAWGEIVWVADPDLGIEIVRIADRDQEKVDGIVQRCLRDATREGPDV